MTLEELQQQEHEAMAALQWLVISLPLVPAALVLWRFW